MKTKSSLLYQCFMHDLEITNVLAQIYQFISYFRKVIQFLQLISNCVIISFLEKESLMKKVMNKIVFSFLMLVLNIQYKMSLLFVPSRWQPCFHTHDILVLLLKFLSQLRPYILYFFFNRQKWRAAILSPIFLYNNNSSTKKGTQKMAQRYLKPKANVIKNLYARYQNMMAYDIPFLFFCHKRKAQFWLRFPFYKFFTVLQNGVFYLGDIMLAKLNSFLKRLLA